MPGPENWTKRSKGFKFSCSPKISILEEMSTKLAQTNKKPIRVIMVGPEDLCEAFSTPLAAGATKMLSTLRQTTSTIQEEEEGEPMMPICHPAPTVRTVTTTFTRTNRPLLRSEFYNTLEDPGASYLASLRTARTMKNRVGVRASAPGAASIASRNTISTFGTKVGELEGDTEDETSRW